MNKAQALAFQCQSRDEHAQEAKGITEALCLAHGRFVVRDAQGLARCTTNREDFARAARLQFNGNVYDRKDWRTNPVTLEHLNLDMQNIA